MAKIGDKVGYDCCTGDTIMWTLPGKKREAAKVVDTWPNGVRLKFKRGNQELICYRELAERGATYVSLREKVAL